MFPNFLRYEALSRLTSREAALIYHVISNNRPSFHMWGKENLVKDRKVSKYYETDCSITMT